MKLEVGKEYLDNDGAFYKIIYKESLLLQSGLNQDIYIGRKIVTDTNDKFEHMLVHQFYENGTTIGGLFSLKEIPKIKTAVVWQLPDIKEPILSIFCNPTWKTKFFECNPKATIISEAEY